MSNEKRKTIPKRSEISVPYTWRLEDIFPTDANWEEEFLSVRQSLRQLGDYQGKLSDSAQNLLAALQFRDQLSKQLGRLYTYAQMRYDQDTTNSYYQALQDRVTSLLSKAQGSMAFLQPEILSIPESTLEAFLEDEKELQVYRFHLQQMNELRPHVLSAEAESLLAKTSEIFRIPSNTFGVLNNADLQFPSIENEHGEKTEVTHGRFLQLLESPHRRVRREAFQAVYHTYGQFKNTFASTLSGNVKKNNLLAQLRNYGSAREAALSKNQIPESVYDGLVTTVREHIPLLRRYIRLRKKALGIDSMHLYDLYAPILPDQPSQRMSYEQAQRILPQALQPLGKEYLSIIEQSFAERWIDVYENKGKRSGAYSFGSYLTRPYVLLNWQDKMDDLFTLAHELGHSVHSYYTRNHQPYVYGDYSIFLAEVASTLNETLLNAHLLKQTQDRNQRLHLLNSHLEKFRAIIFRQTLFAEFEQQIHEKVKAGEALTAENLSASYFELNQAYFGDEIQLDPEISMEWARIPHFYYNFYVYQYATGVSAAIALSKQILEEGQPAVDRYLTFLRSGSSETPIDVLRKAGVDMTSPHPIQQAFDVFLSYLEELEQLI